jgi:hypothetical protein
MCWAQIASEVDLGTGIPTVIQGYTVAVLLKAVRIWWDDHNGILLPKWCMTSMYWYILVCTVTWKVCNSMF